MSPKGASPDLADLSEGYGFRLTKAAVAPIPPINCSPGIDDEEKYLYSDSAQLVDITGFHPAIGPPARH